MAKYDYASKDDPKQAGTIEEAVRITVINYFHHQLGWSRSKCDQRVEMELERRIPKGLFDTLEGYRNWRLEDARIVDIGAGQGAGVLEALHRGANAYGIEPGPEFAALARRRLEKDGYDPNRIYETAGEDLPFPDKTFDYAISLQVLEHVENPLPLLEEMYRVLKPGGEAVVRCENYLAFFEQHYRVPWLPLLPKPIGSIYLKAIGRDSSFLDEYVYYTTYTGVWSLSKDIGFKNETYKKIEEKAENIKEINREMYKITGRILQFLPVQVRRLLARSWMHATNLFTVGVNLHLKRPKS